MRRVEFKSLSVLTGNKKRTGGLGNHDRLADAPESVAILSYVYLRSPDGFSPPLGDFFFSHGELRHA